jgi:magnesium transporter
MDKNLDLLLGNPVYVGDRPAVEMDLSVITYNAKSAQIKKLSGIDELLNYKLNSGLSWINVSGLKDIDSIKKLGEFFNIHPLSVEDILNTEQQPKVEIFGDYRFFSLKTIQNEKSFNHDEKGKNKQSGEADEFIIDQISLVILKNVLITFQEIPGDLFNKVRRRILEDVGEIRKMGIDYLFYAIVDSVVDEYFLVLNHLESGIENFEDRAIKTNDKKFIEEVQDIKKYLFRIKHAVSSLKDNVQVITNRGKFFQTDYLRPFIQDLNDHLNNAVLKIDHYREWLNNIMDVNLSVLSHQMNKVMKVLATISTIFIPLTFIAGIYGMNFEYMPETKQAFGYPIVLGGMGLIALIMIIIFKIRRWF